MNGIDSLNSSALYFSAAQAASKKLQSEQEKVKTNKAKTSFSDMVGKQEEALQLASLGLPVEIAGLSVEDAVVYLKDAVDEAGDKLSEQFNDVNVASFKKAVSQFIKYVEKNNYEIKSRKRFGLSHKKTVYFEEKRPRDPLFQVRVVNEKLAELTAMVMQNHADKIKMLSKVEEIKGLLVDFLAE